MHTRHDTTLERPQASPPATPDLLVFEGMHRDWTGALHLQPSARGVHRVHDGARGRYFGLGEDVEILWQSAVLERFRVVNGRLVHVDLIAADAETDPSRAVMAAPRIAIVTAYHAEPRRLLERCLDSVRAQSVRVDHIVVADGRPQDWIDDRGLRHIRLDKSHGDYGNTPRGIGALLAIAEDYDAIAFLDADNWFTPDHVARAIVAAKTTKTPCDFVIGQRNMMRPDETILPIEDEQIDHHVDTNCYVFFPGSFHVLQKFAVIPRELSGIGDRIFYGNLKAAGLVSAIIPAKTVNYHCLWASLYRAVGETPPPGAKPNIDQTPMIAWLTSLPPERRLVVSRRTGLQLL